MFPETFSVFNSGWKHPVHSSVFCDDKQQCFTSHKFWNRIFYV